MIPTFKQFMSSKIVNSEKNKSYYQLHGVKIMRALHNKSTIKQKIYKNMLTRQSDMD